MNHIGCFNFDYGVEYDGAVRVNMSKTEPMFVAGAEKGTRASCDKLHHKKLLFCPTAANHLGPPFFVGKTLRNTINLNVILACFVISVLRLRVESPHVQDCTVLDLSVG